MLRRFFSDHVEEGKSNVALEFNYVVTIDLDLQG